MRVAVVYCYPLVNARVYFPLAKRFVDTYLQFPAGYPHELNIGCNGGPPANLDLKLFAPLRAVVKGRSNVGWDIGLFQESAEFVPCDLLVCFGAMVHFYRPDWLKRMVEAVQENGPGLYGCAAYLAPNWHVRTTAFWMPPPILQSYPYVIGSAKGSRYDFEHGPNSFTRHALNLGFPCIMSTWLGNFPFEQWAAHAPGPNEILVRDQHIHV